VIKLLSMDQDPALQDPASLLVFFEEANPGNNNLPATSMTHIRDLANRKPAHAFGVVTMVKRSIS
jgi:hypothetical protein